MSGNRNDMAWKVLKRDIVFQDTWVSTMRQSKVLALPTTFTEM